MNISSITPIKISSSNIIVDQPSIFLVIPDTNIKIWDQIYNTNFLLANCEGIICPSKVYTFMKRKFNGKIHVLDLKKKLIETETKTKKLKVFNSIHVSESKESNKNYYFYDMSIYTEAIGQLQDKITPKVLIKELIKNIESTYQTLKSNYPNYYVDIIFLMKDNLGYFNQMFQDIRMLLPKDELNKHTFFDHFTFVSTSNRYLIPILNRLEGKNLYITQNLTKLPGYFVEDEISAKEQIVEPKQEEDNTPKDNVAKDLVKDLSGEITTKTKIDDDGNVNVEINTNQLKKVLKNYDIDDPTILSNVKTAIDKYLSKDKGKLKQDEAEILILKAINKTIHGTEELREKYVDNPKLLFDKLKDTKTYQVPLAFPTYDNELIQPKNIVDLNYTCGQYRQKFEFSDAVHQNVEKLFRTLEESPNYPIKVKKIEHEVIDNNKDRLIQYTITVQNIGGGFKEPYELKINIPGLVSERYFKLKDSHYVMKTQQFLKPLTKTDPNEVRLLSSYAIVRVSLKNFKFSSANIQEIIDYVKIKYPQIIEEETDEYIKFVDDEKIGLAGNLVYESHDQKVTVDPDTNIISDLAGKKLNTTKFEYQLDVIFDKIKTVNPSESLSKSKLKIPYLEIYLGGIRLPLIVYLWSQKGLLVSLNDESIDYKLNDEEDKKATFNVRVNDKILSVYPNTFRQKCFVNGLLTLDLKDKVFTDLNNPESSYDVITEYTKSSGTIRMISLLTENEIDPITRDLLEFEGHSTNFVRLVGKDAIDKLFKQKPDSLSDLSIYRTRLSEMIFAVLYKQLKMAHNAHRNRVFAYEDENSKVEIFEDFITQNLVTTSGVLQNTEPFNPVDEIMLASRVIKTGKGGVPSKHSFKTEHRNIHKSMYGNISAASTSESSDVGLVNHHTLTPSIINQYGNYGIKDIDGLSGWEVLALDEALTPMQNSCDSDRLVMARTHATQIVPVENSEIPLVMTGAEHITGQIASTRFIHRAKYGGKVIEVVPDKYISVKYDNGVVENLDIIPRKSRTKRGSFIQLEMGTLEKDTLFKKNDTLAWTKNFNQGIYSGGKNAVVCFMNYRGYCHEDSYTITEDLADKIKRTIIKPINIVIPPGTKILNIQEEKKTVETGDLLVEFVTDLNLEEYLKAQDIDIEDEEFEKSLISQTSRSIKLQALFSGEIVDMKIFLNTKRDMDPRILNLHKKLVEEDTKLIKTLAKNKNKDDVMSSLDNMDTSYFEVGGHKLRGGKEYLGAKIEFYIREEHTLLAGDKMTNRFGSKGVISYRIDRDNEPYTEITGLKPEVFISPISVFSRKNIPFLKELYIGKIFHFLQKQCVDLAGIPKVTNDKIIKKILGVYQILASERVYKEVEKQLNSIKPNRFRQQLKENKLNLRLIIEPFNNIEMVAIKRAADFIDIPLDEKVFIPELGAYTDIEVPVGIGYYLFMEQISEDYSNIRGADVYTGLTKQPTKGKQRGGGQSISGQDIHALLSLDADNCLNELMTLRSDDHQNKRKVYLDIMNTGELADMPKDTGGGGTTNLFSLYTKGMGLEIS